MNRFIHPTLSEAAEGGESRPTVTAGTTLDYQRVFDRLVAQYSRLDPTPLDAPRMVLFTKWLCEERIKRQWASATWRHYRAATILCIEASIEAATHETAKEHLREAIEALYESTIDTEDSSAFPDSNAEADSLLPVRKPKLRTSQKKSKSIPLERLTKILASLDEADSKRKWAAELRDFLLTILYTGMRPVETSTARIVDDAVLGKLLVVRNAKATNGRGNGEYRQLNLNDMPYDRLAVIARHIKRANEAHVAGGYRALFKGCSKLLFSLVRKLFPQLERRPTLYSARHQFIANAKAEGLSQLEIAAMAGHNSEDTSKHHYARARHGHSRVRARPTESSKQGIREGREWRPASTTNPPRNTVRNRL